MRILLIEDDSTLAGEMRKLLNREYVVDVAPNGEEGVFMSQTSHYEVIFIDIGLPDINGIEVCRLIRQAGVTAGIIMLTAKMDGGYKVHSLDSGADDYITKPFNINELFARTRAVSRRIISNKTEGLLKMDGVLLDTSSKVVYREGKKLNLKRKEFEILEHLIQRRGSIVSRESLLEALWDGGLDTPSNTLDVHVARLRHKFDKPFKKALITTVHGVGYKIDLVIGGDTTEQNNRKYIKRKSPDYSEGEFS
jgi:DNA-binding response OmpR family regulator